MHEYSYYFSSVTLINLNNNYRRSSAETKQKLEDIKTHNIDQKSLPNIYVNIIQLYNIILMYNICTLSI